MIRSIRGTSAKTMATLAAATGLISFVHSASAQTWVDPTSGSWSVPANWVGGTVPVSSPATQLTFNASGTSYTSTNNITPNFNFASITLNSTGAGVITVNGNGITNTSDDQSAVIKTGTGAAVLTGGGTLGTMRVNQGTLTTSGSWTLTSAKRQNDTLTSTNNGFWAGNIGGVDGQFGAWIQDGGVIRTNGNGIAVAASANGSGLFRMQNGAVWNDTLSRMTVNQGNGTIEVLSGSNANVFLIDLG